MEKVPGWVKLPELCLKVTARNCRPGGDNDLINMLWLQDDCM